MSISDRPNGVRGWESDEKSVFGQSQSVEKCTFFQKLGFALGLYRGRVRGRVSFRVAFLIVPK